MKPKSHEENRTKVCILCLKKNFLQPLSTNAIDIIEQHFLPDVKIISWYYPTNICRACSYVVHTFRDSNEPVSVYAYKYNVKSTTRSSITCSCEICTAARITITPKSKGKRGRPSSSDNAKRRCQLNLCMSCYGEKAKGKPHVCTKTVAQRNMLNILQNSNVGDSAVAEYMRSKNTSEENQVMLSNLRGLPSTWKFDQNAAKVKKPYMSADDLFLIKKTCDLSTRRTLKLSTCLRALDIEIAPNFSTAITCMNQSLQDFFEVTRQPFEMSDNTQVVSKPVVYCNNVQGLVDHIISKRGVEVAKTFCKIGVDGGGGSFKVTLSIIAGDTEVVEERSRCKDTGVKMLLLLAVAPGVPEKYVNVERIWKGLLHLESLKCFVAGDLKIVNLLCGIMGHSSSFPCPYCTAPKTTLSKEHGSPRTVGQIREHTMRWKSLGSDSKQAKQFFNCIEEPLVGGLSEDKIVNICPPPSLHITLGIVNAIYKEVESIDPETAKEWVRISSCQRHSKFGFTGRNCQKLIQNRHVLQQDGNLRLLRTVSYPHLRYIHDILISSTNYISGT